MGVLRTLRLISERDGRRPGWWRPLRSLLLRSLRVPGTGARFSDSSRSPDPGGGPRAPGLTLSPASFLAPPKLQPAMGPGSHPRSRLAVPGQGWHRVQASAGGPPAPSEQGRDTSPSAGAGEAALGAAFRGRAGGRMWSEAIVSLTLPGDPLLLPAPLPGAARSPLGRPERSAGGLSLPLGGKEGGSGASGGRAPAGNLQIPGQHRRGSPRRDGCVRARGYRCYLPFTPLPSPAVYGADGNLPPGLPGGRDAPAAPRSRRDRGRGGSPLPPPPVTPSFF